MKLVKKTGLLCICLALLLPLFTQTRAEAADIKEYKFNMTYIYFGDSVNFTGLVDKTQDSLSEVSPNYFALSSAGGLVLTSSLSASFIEDMHQRGIDVVPYLTNDWSRAVGRAALRNREKLAEDLADAVRTYGLDGVNIDIENVTVSEREAYVDFVRLLRARMPEGSRLVVSVAANPWGISTGWQGSYDYAALAKYCDYLMMMTYDEHYSGGPAGPISSLSYIKNSIEYALSVIPKEQLVLGLPFYGRIWSDSGGHPDGYGVSNATIARYVNTYGGSVSLDKTSMSARAVITIGPDDKKPVIGGRELEPGTYTIWYESEQSVKAKLELIAQYDIKGTGSWCLGQETSSTWNYYKLWLNNCTFGDIETNWARDYILDAYMNNCVTGYSSEAFSPDTPLTRAQAAAVLIRKLGLIPEFDTKYGFADCGGSWAQAYIETARKYGIVNGIGSNLYEPDRAITREEIAVMLNNALSLQTNGGGAPFADVSPVNNAWSYDAISALSSCGVLDGYPDGTYQPCAPLTRAQMTVLLAKIPAAEIFTGDMPIYVQI